MKDKPDTKPDQVASRERDASVSYLFLSMADTTWRMFTPPALLVPGGIWFDLKFGTKPWVTLLSAAIGLTLAVLLVKKQLGGAR